MIINKESYYNLLLVDNYLYFFYFNKDNYPSITNKKFIFILWAKQHVTNFKLLMPYNLR